MRQRRNYGFERRRKADVRRAKQEEKRQRKTDRAASGAVGPEMGEMPDSGAQPGMWEWFSPSRSQTVAVQSGLRPASGPPDDWVLLTDRAAATDTGDHGDRRDEIGQ